MVDELKLILILFSCVIIAITKSVLAVFSVSIPTNSHIIVLAQSKTILTCYCFLNEDYAFVRFSH